MIKINQITPDKLLSNSNRLDEYLKEEFSVLVSETK